LISLSYHLIVAVLFVLLKPVLFIDILKESFMSWAIGKYFENFSIAATIRAMLENKLPFLIERGLPRKNICTG
jgi:hypothetical protein